MGNTCAFGEKGQKRFPKSQLRSLQGRAITETCACRPFFPTSSSARADREHTWSVFLSAAEKCPRERDEEVLKLKISAASRKKVLKSKNLISICLVNERHASNRFQRCSSSWGDDHWDPQSHPKLSRNPFLRPFRASQKVNIIVLRAKDGEKSTRSVLLFLLNYRQKKLLNDAGGGSQSAPGKYLSLVLYGNMFVRSVSEH